MVRLATSAYCWTSAVRLYYRYGQEETNLSLAQKKAVDNYRARQRRRGLLRLEVQAPAADVPMLRQLAQVLRENSESAAELRRVLSRALAPEASEGSLKRLLEAAPLDGVDLSRPRDLGREVEL